MADPDDSKLSSSLLAVQQRAQKEAQQRRHKRDEKRAKRRAKNMPVVFSVVLFALVSLSVGIALGALSTSQIPAMTSDEMGGVGLLAFISGVLGAVLGGLAIYQGGRAKRYSEQTPGVVSSARIVGRPGGSQTGSSVMYSVDAKVTYEVSGTQHTVAWYPGGSSNMYRDGAAEKYMGRVVTVSFNPNDPTSAITARPERAFKVARVMLGFFGAVTGAASALLLSF